MLRGLKQLGFQLRRWVECRDIAAVIERATELQQREGELAYDMDGAVVKVNRLAPGGSSGHGKAPRFAMAYKYCASRRKPSCAITRASGRTAC